MKIHGKLLKYALFLFSQIITGALANSSSNISQPEKALIPELPVDLIQQHVNDIDEIYSQWIRPLRNENGMIKWRDGNELNAAISSLKKGIDSFCVASEGVVKHTPQKYGDHYKCEKLDGTFIGSLEFERFTGNNLAVRYESPKTIERAAAQKKYFQEKYSQNGPTGKIVTKDGTFSFLRFGNLNERVLVRIRPSQEGMDRIPIEDMARIDFKESCCDITVT